MKRSRVAVVLLLLLLVPVGWAGLLLLRAQRLLSDPTNLAQLFPVESGIEIERQSIEPSFWPPGAVVRGVTVPDNSLYGPGQLASADAVWLRVGLRALLRGEMVVEEVLLEKPVVRIVRGKDGWNIAPFLPVLGTSPMLRPLSIEASGARVIYRDRARPGIAEVEIRNGVLSAGRASIDTAWEVRLAGSTREVGEGGDEPGSLDLELRIPTSEADPMVGNANLRDFEGAQFEELVQLLGGDMPFGVRTQGKVSGNLGLKIPRRLPAFPITVDATVDYADAAIVSSGGWTLKPRETPLNVQIRLLADTSGVSLRALSAESGSARLVGEKLHPGGDGLRLSSSGLDGRSLERFLPILAGVRPRGALEVEGTVEPREEGSDVVFSISGQGMELLSESRRWTLGRAGFEVGVRPGGEVGVGLDLVDLENAEFGVGRIRVGYIVREGLPSRLSVVASGGGRAGSEIENLEISGAVSEGRFEIERLSLDGLGGNLSATAAVSRVPELGWAIEFDPQWDGLELGAVLGLIGFREDASGRSRGRALLASSGEGAGALLANLNGSIEFGLRDGRVEAVNLARSTLSGLERVPGLANAIRDGLGGSLPELVASATQVDNLLAVGSLSEGIFEVDQLSVASPMYSFSGRGDLASTGAVTLRGDLQFTRSATEKLRLDAPIFDSLLGDQADLRIPVEVEGTYPKLRSAPLSGFTRDVAKRLLDNDETSPKQMIRDLLGRHD